MRKSLGILLGVLVVLASASQAMGERRRRAPRQPAEEAPPASAEISTDMGKIQWGWDHKRLVAHYTQELRALYRPLLAKAGDAIAEDALRRQMEDRISRIAKSYVEFGGQRTGWDASLIRDQYTHNNGESLVEVREIREGGATPRYTDYFLFINDHLWRRFRAFNQDQFAGLSFDEAAQVFERRYGKSRPVYNAAEDGTKRLVALEWQDDATSLKAVDNTPFYGVLCLIYSERATEKQLDKLRSNRGDEKRATSPLLDALDDTGDEDVHANVVEHITGKRYKTAQPQGGVAPAGATKASGSSPTPTKASTGTIFDEPSTPRPTKGRADPLDDLDI